MVAHHVFMFVIVLSYSMLSSHVVIVVIFVTFDVSREKILRQKPVSAKAEFKKNRDGMGFMIEGDVRIIIIISILP